MITDTGCFWIGFLLVGLCIVLFNSLLWGFLIGTLLGLIIVTIDRIFDIKGRLSDE